MILMSQVLSDNLIKNLDEGVMKSWLQSVLPSVLGFFWSVVLALLIAYIGGKIINLVRRMFQKSLRRRDAEEGVCQFADQVLKYFLWIVIIVIILGLFGFILACSRSGIFGCDGRSCFTGKFVELCGWSFDSRFASFPRGRLYH